MNILQRLICIFALPLFILCSCSSSGDEISDYVDQISHCLANNQADSLLNIYVELKQRNDIELNKAIYEQTIDSTTRVRAMALVMTHSPQNIADKILAKPTKDFVREIHNAYLILNAREDYKAVMTASQEKFDKMSAEAQAHIISSYLTPEQAAAGMNNDDKQLIEAMRKLYSSNPEDLDLFNEALK